jgi:hypothetical protein
MWCSIEVELSESILLAFEVEYEYECGKRACCWDPGEPTEFGINKFILISVCINGTEFNLRQCNAMHNKMLFNKIELSEKEFDFFFDSVDDEVERIAIEEYENQREMQYEAIVDRVEFKQERW